MKLALEPFLATSLYFLARASDAFLSSAMPVRRACFVCNVATIVCPSPCMLNDEWLFQGLAPYTSSFSSPVSSNFNSKYAVGLR